MSVGFFPEVWKIAHVTPLFKKDDPQLCTNYRPISLLPCISKVFEKLLFNHIYSFLKAHGLIKENQSGFTPGDSTINQLIAICNKLYSCLDDGNEMIGVFLDFTKAFDRVWHKGLLYKLRKIGIHGKLYDLLESYLMDRKQSVVIDGCKSELLPIRAGVPQGSVLGPLLFLIYINDISDDFDIDSFLFADDTSMLDCVINGNTQHTCTIINEHLVKVNRWANQWLVSINASKTVVMLFSKKRSPSKMLPIKLGQDTLRNVDFHKHLGIFFSSNLSWTKHIDYITGKSNKVLGMLKRHKYEWSRATLEVFYKSFVRSILEYGNIIYDSCSQSDSDQLEGIQLEAARIVTGGKRCTSHSALYAELGWQTLKIRRKINKLIKVYCIIQRRAPRYLQNIFSSYFATSAYTTRLQASNSFTLPKCNTTFYQKSPVISSLSAWNDLSSDLKDLPSVALFKKHLQLHYYVKPLPFNHNTTRQLQVIFTQIRMGFSNLNYDLFSKGCIENKECDCGFVKEDARHFFLNCPNYSNSRNILKLKIFDIGNITSLTLPILLKGNELLSC